MESIEKKKIEISRAKPEDAREITEVFYKTWLKTYPNEKVGVTVEDVEHVYKDSFKKEALEKRALKIADLKEGEHFFVAKEGDVVIGVCRSIENLQNNQLKSLYVLPEFQGMGVGRLLWERVCENFDPSKDIVVHVADYNERAIEFYKKLGFKDTGKKGGRIKI